VEKKIWGKSSRRDGSGGEDGCRRREDPRGLKTHKSRSTDGRGRESLIMVIGKGTMFKAKGKGIAVKTKKEEGKEGKLEGGGKQVLQAVLKGRRHTNGKGSLIEKNRPFGIGRNNIRGKKSAVGEVPM